MNSLEALDRQVIACQRCPRLRRHCREVARVKKREFQDWSYWGKPVPGFGDARARVLIVGLAPAAHGANRTGRIFTGDSSGDFLYRSLHRFGFAALPTSRARADGQRLIDLRITAAVRCAPPDNRPSTAEQARCLDYLTRELGALPALEVIVCLGQIAFAATLRALAHRGLELSSPRPRFAHDAAASLAPGLALITSYHPSRQNTNTGRLTQPMLDAVFARARRMLEGGRQPRR